MQCSSRAIEIQVTIMMAIDKPNTNGKHLTVKADLLEILGIIADHDGITALEIVRIVVKNHGMSNSVDTIAYTRDAYSILNHIESKGLADVKKTDVIQNAIFTKNERTIEALPKKANGDTTPETPDEQEPIPDADNKKYRYIKINQDVRTVCKIVLNPGISIRDISLLTGMQILDVEATVEKLVSYGVAETNNGYVFSTPVMNDVMRMKSDSFKFKPDDGKNIIRNCNWSG